MTSRTWLLLAGLGLVLVAAGVSLKHTLAPKPPAVSFDQRRPWKLRKGQLILVTNEKGSALIQFTAERSSAAEYRWRFKPAGTGSETSGSGRLLELYAEERTGPNEVKVTDVGSCVAVTAGPFILEWSSAGTTGHYLYIDPGVLKARIVVGEFESFPLAPTAGAPAA